VAKSTITDLRFKFISSVLLHFCLTMMHLISVIRTPPYCLWLQRSRIWVWKLYAAKWCLQFWCCDVRTPYWTKISWQVSNPIIHY